jgi:hypothetical protein
MTQQAKENGVQSSSFACREAAPWSRKRSCGKFLESTWPYNRQHGQCLPQYRPAHRGREGPLLSECGKHGLTAAQLVIDAEDREEFDEFQVRLQTDIRPQGALQQILFDQLVGSAWNLRRIRSMEAELTASAQSYRDILDNTELTLTP